MKAEEFAALSTISDKTSVSVSDLVDQSDRTLVYGYDVHRNTVHVYLEDGRIHWLSNGRHESAETWDDAFRLNPGKRAYPQYCDYEFCALLVALDVNISFTTFEEPTRTGPFAGPLF